MPQKRWSSRENKKRLRKERKNQENSENGEMAGMTTGEQKSDSVFIALGQNEDWPQLALKPMIGRKSFLHWEFVLHQNIFGPNFCIKI